jgi:hypothetical protein
MSRWIHMAIRGGSVAVKLINGVEGDFFTTSRGLRQGEPISLILFNYVVDVFTRMLIKEASGGLITGLCTDFVITQIFRLLIN